jgi:hypothetical protein
MPSKSSKQHRFMAMCSTSQGRKKAQGKCPPMKVAKEFRHADKGKHFAAARA